MPVYRGKVGRATVEENDRRVKRGINTILQNVTSIQNENQQEFWRDSRTFLYCFANE